MATCKAGECDVECGTGKGCGCIADSDNPEICSCYCFGGEPTKDLKLQQSTSVDVQIVDLPLFEVAGFLDAVQAERIVVPVDRRNEQISLDLKRVPFDRVLAQLDLTTRESLERARRKFALVAFLAGFAIAALLFSVV